MKEALERAALELKNIGILRREMEDREKLKHSVLIPEPDSMGGMDPVPLRFSISSPETTIRRLRWPTWKKSCITRALFKPAVPEGVRHHRYQYLNRYRIRRPWPC